MKKAEIIFGVVALTALVLNLLLMPKSGVLIFISLLTLSLFYFCLSFALFNGIRFRHIFKKDSYKGISAMRILGAIFAGHALSLIIIGLLFRFQSYPLATTSLVVGLIELGLVLIVGLIRYSKTKSDYYTKIFKRIAVYGGLGLILLLIPKETLLEFKDRNQPDYFEAIEKSMTEPDNMELQEKVNEE